MKSRAQSLLEVHRTCMTEDDWESYLPFDLSAKGPFFPSRNTHQFYQKAFGSGEEHPALALGSKLLSKVRSLPVPAPSHSSLGAAGAHAAELQKSLSYK